METKRIDYKALCEAPFEMESLYEDNFPMLVYTGRKEEERPVFRVAVSYTHLTLPTTERV